MKTICLHFTVHQPVRLRKFRFSEFRDPEYYYNDLHNEFILRRVSENCYLPANKLLIDLINKYNGRFKVSFSISGTAIDQFKKFAPDVLDSFKELAATGCVEFLAETYAHSFAVLKDNQEFTRQVSLHADETERLFGVRPKAFVNTALIYSDQIGEALSKLGFSTVLTEGSDLISKWKSPNVVYQSAQNPALKVLLKNNRLSDDLSFRFSNTNWVGWPLNTQKYVSWLKKTPRHDQIINLFMDYETFGEHQKKDSGIFDFLKSFPAEAFKKSNFNFMTPSEITANYLAVSPISAELPDSYQSNEKDLSVWLGNEMQKAAFNRLYELTPLVKACDDADLQKDWLYLQSSDHFYYMYGRQLKVGKIHSSFNPYESSNVAFLNYLYVLNDFAYRLKPRNTKKLIKHELVVNNSLKMAN